MHTVRLYVDYISLYKKSISIANVNMNFAYRLTPKTKRKHFLMYTRALNKWLKFSDQNLCRRGTQNKYAECTHSVKVATLLVVRKVWSALARILYICIHKHAGLCMLFIDNAYECSRHLLIHAYQRKHVHMTYRFVKKKGNENNTIMYHRFVIPGTYMLYTHIQLQIKGIRRRRSRSRIRHV